jgi:hypothetical protein
MGWVLFVPEAERRLSQGSSLAIIPIQEGSCRHTRTGECCCCYVILIAIYDALTDVISNQYNRYQKS